MQGQPESSPADLLQRAREGDVQAAGELLETYRGYLMTLAEVQVGRRLRGRADPSDVVQETFLHAHRGFASFRGQTEAQLLSWLRQILRSRLLTALERFCGTQARDPGLEDRLDRELDDSSHVLHRLADSGTSPSQAAMRRERAVLLADALARLPDDYREAIVLHHLEGLPFETVARRMGRSEDSVTKLWVRGLAKLQRMLEGQLDDAG